MLVILQRMKKLNPKLILYLLFLQNWWVWLTITGVMLGSAFSVKFVGLFVILLVSFYFNELCKININHEVARSPTAIIPLI